MHQKLVNKNIELVLSMYPVAKICLVRDFLFILNKMSVSFTDYLLCMNDKFYYFFISNILY